MSVKQEDNLSLLSRRETNPRTRIRIQVLEAYNRTNDLEQIASTFNFHKRTIQKWISLFSQYGIDGLRDKPRPGAGTKLKKEDEPKFIKRLFELQDNKPGGRVIATDIQQLLKDEFKAEYPANSIYEVLKRLDIVWITSRSKHPKQNKEDQEEYKKILRNS